MQYDAILVLSFGGPEKHDDVIPFLENVLRGKNVPRERMLEVAEHYYHFDGRSPINEQNRELIAALERELGRTGPRLPVYWGNRNWEPYLADTLRRMADEGVERALAFVTSAYSSYSGCRQYREDVARAREEVGERAPEVHKLRAFFNHPGFIEPMIENAQEALDRIPAERREAAQVVFTAHSVPLSMASSSKYVAQIEEASRLVGAGIGRHQPKLVWQSRSGPPTQPWLEPDILDYLRGLEGVQDIVIVPIGFISDHMEVLYDLDTEAVDVCRELGLNMERAATVGAHPRFVRMIVELVEERMEGGPRLALGSLGPSHDFCPADCCPAPVRPGRPPGT
ncbi:MAG: ferrochelatase [Bryobacterales bacterium]|nr:ferrochelatase [Acidobacteriota bacterium]MCB9384347.1 ferrochelatase [Bryobacterales bacterium]